MKRTRSHPYLLILINMFSSLLNMFSSLISLLYFWKTLFLEENMFSSKNKVFQKYYTCSLPY